MPLPSIPPIAILFFTYPSFFTSSLPRKALERQPAEDCRQNQTTVARTRRPPFERPSNERHERFNQSINQIEPELQYRPVAKSNQGLLGRHPRQPQPANTYRERFELIQSINQSNQYNQSIDRINIINQSIKSIQSIDQSNQYN